jgi:GMP synthase (glutamine-hydrolysing)
MNVFILEHEKSEGPGIFEPLLVEHGLSFKRLRLFKGEVIPSDERPNGILIMGGSMNVYEEGSYPFLAQETAFIQQCITEQVPLLGICLGAQLIAKACGAKVFKAPVRETGWFTVRLTDSGACDPLLKGFPPQFSVFQFHEDTFEIPHGAVHIIDAPHCPSQGFRIGDYIYGLQFHLESTREMVYEWIDKEGCRGKILADTDRNIAACHRLGREFFNRFLVHCTR